MNKISQIFSWLCKGRNPFTLKKVKNNPYEKQGILVFSDTSEVIQSSTILKHAGFNIEIKGPPPQLQTGCDMVILFDLVLEPAILHLLKTSKHEPKAVIALNKNLLEPVSLFQTHDYGDWIMVRAANMKITFEKESGIIVNISGGGCPDVPYLASILLGKNILEAEEPRIQGQTLCAYSLQHAFIYAKDLYRQKGINLNP